jgi:hypothetical protein
MSEDALEATKHDDVPMDIVNKDKMPWSLMLTLKCFWHHAVLTEDVKKASTEPKYSRKELRENAHKKRHNKAMNVIQKEKRTDLKIAQANLDAKLRVCATKETNSRAYYLGKVMGQLENIGANSNLPASVRNAATEKLLVAMNESIDGIPPGGMAKDTVINLLDDSDSNTSRPKKRAAIKRQAADTGPADLADSLTDSSSDDDNEASPSIP